MPKEGDTAETWKKNGAQASIEFNVLSMSNVENWLNGREVNAKEDFTIGGKTFKVYADARANNLSLYLLSDTENGLYKFETSEKDFDEMPTIKQVLEAVSFK